MKCYVIDFNIIIICPLQNYYTAASQANIATVGPLIWLINHVLIIMRLTLPTIKCHVPHVASFVSGDLEVSFMKGFWLRLCFMVAQSHIGYSWQIQCTYCGDRAHVLFGATRFVSVVPHYL